MSDTSDTETDFVGPSATFVLGQALAAQVEQEGHGFQSNGDGAADPTWETLTVVGDEDKRRQLVALNAQWLDEAEHDSAQYS